MLSKLSVFFHWLGRMEAATHHATTPVVPTISHGYPVLGALPRSRPVGKMACFIYKLELWYTVLYIIPNSLFNMDSQQHNSDGQVEFVDDDKVPHQYQERHISKRDLMRGQIRRGNTPSRRNNRSTQCKLPFHRTKRRADVQVAPKAALVNEPPWTLQAINKWVDPASQQSSSNPKDERKRKGNVETLLEIQKHQEMDCDVDQPKVSRQKMIELEQQFQNTPQGKKCEWMAKEKELQRQIHQAKQYAAEKDQIFQAQIHDIQLEKSALEAKHYEFILKQQEASFRQVESTRWRPEDETKIRSDLDILKRDMRGWAKTNSINEISNLQSLPVVESTALMQQLSNVVLSENGELPEGISTAAKSPMLLLNALLADHVYMSFFRSPFFFLGGSIADSSSNDRPDGVLEDIYQRAKSGKLILAYQAVSL